MSRLAPVLVTLCLLGCTARPHSAVITRLPSEPAPTNLVLGPSATHAWLAPAMGWRTEWPALISGYRFDDTSYVTEYGYDDQSFYDRLGGGFHREVESVRTSVFVR